MATKRPTNPLALAVLTLVFERPMHPYQMSATLRERAKEQSIKLNYGSLYAVVESLQNRGLIAAQEVVREGRRPERTIYTITDDGERLMSDWLSELLSTPEKEFPKFMAALSLMAILSPDETIELLDARLKRLRMQRKQAQVMRDQIAAQGFPRLFTIEHDFEFALLNAEVEFVNDLLEDLRNGTFGGLRVWRRMHELREAGTSADDIDSKISEEFREELSFLDNLNS